MKGTAKVSQTQIKLYYKNVMADVIGDDHGITTQQLKEFAKKRFNIE